MSVEVFETDYCIGGELYRAQTVSSRRLQEYFASTLSI